MNVYLSDVAKNIVAFKTDHDDLNIRTLMYVNEIKACRLVQRCMGGNVWSKVVNYFVKRDHSVHGDQKE